MTDAHGHSLPQLPDGGELDAANQSLADALRKSFAVLKAIMLVMVVAYLLSGWFRVQPGEVGFVVRMGEVVGNKADRVLDPGWHWAFPYPIDQVITVPTQKERLLPVAFMFNVSEEDKLRGIRRIVFGPLSPLRDNYLVTGDANILHAQMTARYRISDPVAYVSNLLDTSPSDSNPPEAEILSSVFEDAAVRTAARTALTDIYGPGQQDFLNRVAEAARQNLKKLEDEGLPIGVEIVGVLAPQIANLEAILPPRQVQTQFDEVLAAEQKKIRTIREAEGKAAELLNRTAGPTHDELDAAVRAEFEAQLAVLHAERTPSQDSGRAAADAELAKHRQATNEKLLAASGDVQRLINDARSQRDRIINEARADYEQILRLQDEYRRNPTFLLSRLRVEFVQQVVANAAINKWYLPDTGYYWLVIPRDPEAAAKLTPKRPGDDASQAAPEGFIERNPIRTKPQQLK